MLYGYQAIGQDKINISAGFGMMEMINLGIQFPGKENQLGFSFGYFPDKNGSVITISGDLFFHIAGSSELSNRRPWFIKTGIMYFRTESNKYIDKYVLLNLRIGREMNFSKKVGIAVDGGPMIKLFNIKSEKKPESGWNWPVYPGLGMRLFYKI